MTTGSPPQENTGTSNEAERPRYYILGDDGFEARFDFVNEDKVLIDRQRGGTHAVRPRDLDFVTWVGLPPVRERPKLKVGSSRRGKGPLDVYSNKFFSDRYKKLLCEFVPHDAVEMIECDAIDLKRQDAGPYWWIDFIRVLDAVDEENSVLTRQIDNPFSSGDDIDRVRYRDLQDIRFRVDVVGDNHIFRLSLATWFIIVDGDVADRIRAADIAGATLTPLQPPTPEEQQTHWRFKNYPYWTNKRSPT